MTVKDFLDALTSKVSVSIVNNESDAEVINVKNDAGVSDNLAASVSGATVKRISVESASLVKVVIETA